MRLRQVVRGWKHSDQPKGAARRKHMARIARKRIKRTTNGGAVRTMFYGLLLHKEARPDGS